MLEAWQWWSVYGPFREGVNGLPHTGDVIKYYRKMRGMTIEQFACAYHCTVNHAWQLEGPKNMSQPINPGKRQVLATILHVPPALLGLSLLGLSETPTRFKDTHDMLLEDMLGLSWQTFYSGDFQQATRNIATWLYALEQSVAQATGPEKARLQTLWAKYLILSAASLQDRGAEQEAIVEATKAVTIAREAGNAELLVTALQRRFRVYEQTEEYTKSLADINEALKLVKAGGMPEVLTGAICFNAGEVWTNIAQHDPTMRSTALRYYDKAAHIARMGSQGAENPPGVYIQFGLALVLQERAVAVASFGQLRGATQDLKAARASMPHGNVQWLKNIVLTDAELRVKEEDTQGAVVLLKEALQVHQDLNSRSDYFWMRRITRRILQQEPNNTEAQRLLLSL